MSFAPTAQLWVDAHGQTHRRDARGSRVIAGDPINALAQFVEEAVPLPSLHGAPRTVGYLGYDLGPVLEPHLASRASQTGEPLGLLARYDAVVSCVPMAEGLDPPCRIFVDAADEASGTALLDAIADDTPQPTFLPSAARLVESPSWPEYQRAIADALDYIASGDVYQVNIARRFRAECSKPPADAYLALRAAQPVPYGVFLDCGDFSVLSNSPERFLRVHGDSISTEPIKGTRRRHSDPRIDQDLRDELRADPKEQAEHVMILDLERNDLGRISERGTVHVTSLLRLESFATLHHLVSTVEARLTPKTELASILRATFPGGSITGAPKIRATEVIEELEPVGRGLYTGSLLWFRDASDFDSSIAIRTAIARDGAYAYHAGGGIVADSDPRREWDECWLKARAFLSALFGDEVAARLTAESARSAGASDETARPSHAPRSAS